MADIVRVLPVDECCCSGSTPDDCKCALLIPIPPASPFASLADAETFLATPFAIVDCLGYINYAGGANVTSASASFDGTTFSMAAAFDAAITSCSAYIQITAKAGATITMVTNAPYMAGGIYDCAGNSVEAFPFPSGPSKTSNPLPAAGTYYIFLFPVGAVPPFPPTTFSSVTITVTSSNTFVVNPPVVRYDDSGTERYLEACPRLLVPSESTWAGSLAEATALMTGDYSPLGGPSYLGPGAVDCLAFCVANPNILSASVALGSGSFNMHFSTSPNSGGAMVAEVMLEAGDAITIGFTYGGTGGGEAHLASDDGSWQLIASSVGPTGIESGTVPYTGKYRFTISGGADGGSGSTGPVAGSISSSGTIGGCPPQFLYDVGLTCPARLECS